MSSRAGPYDDDLASLAHYVANNGGEAVDMLRSNLAGDTTHVQAEGSPVMQGLPAYQRVETELAQLQAAKQAGTLDPVRVDALEAELVARVEALEVNGEGHPETAIEHEMDAINDQLYRLSDLR